MSTLAQGDILLQFPVPEVPENYLDYVDSGNVPMVVNYRDLIVMTQSCDLAICENGKFKVEYVLLCPISLSKCGDGLTQLRDDCWDHKSLHSVAGGAIASSISQSQAVSGGNVVDLLPLTT